MKFEKLWRTLANVSIVLYLVALCRYTFRNWHALPTDSHMGLASFGICSILLWLSLLREKSSTMCLIFLGLTLISAVVVIFPYPG
jgi:hypothetical protein